MKDRRLTRMHTRGVRKRDFLSHTGSKFAARVAEGVTLRVRCLFVRKETSRCPYFELGLFFLKKRKVFFERDT